MKQIIIELLTTIIQQIKTTNMKKLLLKFLKKTVKRELSDMWFRNTTPEERATLLTWLKSIRHRHEGQQNCATDTLDTIIESL